MALRSLYFPLIVIIGITGRGEKKKPAHKKLKSKA
jgi:hypothetical protein